jgi:hypothetical protein
MWKMSFDVRKFAAEMMGKPVAFDAHLWRGYSEDGKTRVWHKNENPERHGWLVGVTWVQTGHCVDGYGGGYNILGELDDYDPPTFVETGPRQLVYLVSPWPTMRPLKVPPEHVRLVDPEDFRPSSWDDEMKELTRESAKHWKRDKKGRWVKEGEGDGILRK